MADDCDPAVLHARVCVLESDSKRHESDISQIWNEVSTLKIYASTLPEIKERLIAIQEQVSNLRDCSIKSDAKVTTLTAIWRIVNQPVTMFASFAIVMIYLHYVGK